jgi:diketogulonate reductase-like aldo/keto reductase
MERRNLMKATAGAAAAAVTTPAMVSPSPAMATPSVDMVAATSQGGAVKATGPVTSKLAQHPDMKYRPLGTTGELISMVGLGGFHLAKPHGATSDEAVRIVHAAIDAGITFFDNCWDYNGGESEVRLGKALAGGKRDQVFLMTKIDGRTAEAATRQLDESLKRLQTDHLDLLQFHEIIRMEDPEAVFAAGGALEAMLRAKQAGKLRYIGFTGHKSPAIHKHMFDVADRHQFHFDTVQMPLNVMDAHYDSFEQGVLPVALAHGTGVLGMKSFGDPFILDSKAATPMEMLHYPMSLPVSLQVMGIDSLPILQQTLDAVRSFKPFSPEQRATLLAKTEAIARDGRTERYKVSHHFDGTIQNPQWLS